MVRWMWSYAINPYMVFVRADADVNSYKDLEGKKFARDRRVPAVKRNSPKS